MRLHALCVVSDNQGSFGWEVHARGLHPQMFEPFSASAFDYRSYRAALEAGVLALAQADAPAVGGEDAANEAARPLTQEFAGR